MNEIPENPFTEVKCSLFTLDLLVAKDEPDIVERDLGAGWYPSLLVHSHNCSPLLWLLALPSEQASGHIVNFTHIVANCWKQVCGHQDAVCWVNRSRSVGASFLCCICVVSLPVNNLSSSRFFLCLQKIHAFL